MAYTPPVGNQVDFNLTLYIPPTGDDVELLLVDTQVNFFQLL